MYDLSIMARITTLLLRAPSDDGGAGGGAGAGADTTAGGGAGADTTAGGGAGADTMTGGGAAQKWWEAMPEPQRQFLTAKGLTIDDQAQGLPKVIDIASNAEKRIGKGLDNILDKPGKDEAYGDWARKNAAALGLPEKEEGYAVQRPDFWPKDAPWDDKLEGAARALAFKHGLPPAAFQYFVNLQAQSVKSLLDSTDTALACARENMMT
jgi:hypothetical protein